MRVAMITTMQHPASSNTGWGAENYIWNLVECLDKEGHEVMLFAKEGSVKPEHGELIVCENEDEVLYKHAKRLSEVHIVHDFSATKQVHDFCHQYYIRSIATNFNIHYNYPLVHKNIVCVSECQKILGLAGKSGFEGTPWEQQVGNTGQLRSHAKVIYLGINLDLYTPKYEKQDYIIFMNSWDYRKGVHIAVELAKQMGFKLILAGSTQHPEHKATFEYLKPIMDTCSNIQYFTDITNEQKIELLQNAKAMIFPSLFHQPYAVVCVEALACGTPIITTNLGAMPEIINHGKTGFLCSNMEELSKAINSIKTIDNKDCRIDAEKRFDRKIMAQEYIKLYEKIVAGESW